MRAYCYVCQADTLVHANGLCGFCETRITNPHSRSRDNLGGHSYIGNEDFYRRTYERYLEVRSLRKIAAEVWEEAGYANQRSCASTLHEAWLARGWQTYQRGYAMTKHGKLITGRRDRQYVRELRVARGEIRAVLCKGRKMTRPAKGRPCKRFAIAGSEYCLFHHPARRSEIVDRANKMRARVGQAG